MLKTRLLLAAVFDDAPPAKACQACQDGLVAYVEAALDGQPAASLFPVVAKHLETCVACQQEHNELKSLLVSERQERFEQPPMPARFDFAFLPPVERSPARRPWRLDTLGRVVVQFSTDLLRSLQPPVYQPAYLKGDTPASLNYELTEQIDDLNVRINLEPLHRDPQRMSVEVEVEIPSRGGWPNLAGNTVTLRRGTEQLLEEQETDAFGKALFEDVSAEDLPSLVFEIAVI